MRAFFIKLIFFMTVFWTPSLGQTEPGRVLPLATVEFPPFHYGEGGRVAGFITETVEVTLRRMGYEPQIDIYPSKRGKHLAKTGKLAGIFAFTKKPERLQNYHFTRSLGTIRDVFFKRKGEDITWEELADLQPYLIGATETYNYAPVFLAAVGVGAINTDMVVSQKPEVLHLRKLVAGRIDLAICEISLCNFIIAKSAPEFDRIDFIDKAIGPVRTFHMGISRNWPDAARLTREFDAALSDLQAEGVIAEIHRRYGIVPYEE